MCQIVVCEPGDILSRDECKIQCREIARSVGRRKEKNVNANSCGWKLTMARGPTRKVFIGYFPTQERAWTVACALEWDSSWKPVVSLDDGVLKKENPESMPDISQMNMDILHIYGKGLPAAGAAFLAPCGKVGFSSKIVREAYGAAAKHWPPMRGYAASGRASLSIYRDRYATGELANGEAEKVINFKAFREARFFWNGNAFVKITE